MRNIPDQVRESDTLVRGFFREHLPGLEQADNPVAQQIDAGKPLFAVPNEMLEWGEAIADAAFFRLAWSLAEPTRPTYERFVQSVAKGADRFRGGAYAMRRLTEPFVAQLGGERLFADLANRNHGLQGSGVDEALNRRFLCAAALANHMPVSRRKNAHYKPSLIVDPRERSKPLTDFVPQTALRTLGNYLMLTFIGPVDRNIEPWGDESRTFADFRHETTAIDTRCMFYERSYPLERPWLVANGTLLDITTTRRMKPSLHKSLRTLAGFVLADTEDAFGIQNIAWYHAPSGQLYEQGTGEFLEQLGATADVAQLRARFADRAVEYHGGNSHFLNH